jgi:Transposase IS200 like
MPFHRVYYHVIWATHHRQPLLIYEVEKRVIEVIRQRSEKLRSEIWAVNGTGRSHPYRSQHCPERRGCHLGTRGKGLIGI